MPVLHFSHLDGNFPYRCPSSENATGTSGCPPPPIKLAPPKKSDCTDKQSGSIIECQNQILGEALNITGTPFSLHYQSDRVPGRKADNTVEIPLSGATVSQDLTHIDLQVLVAGQKFVQSFPAAPNHRTTFTWDGQDAYHRTVQGEQPVTVTVTYFYRARYVAASASGGGITSVVPGFSGFATGTLWDDTRQEFYVPKTYQTSVGTWDAKALDLGGWSLHVHHAYNPVTKALHLGDGSRRSVDSLGQIITTIAGGVPARSAMAARPRKHNSFSPLEWRWVQTAASISQNGPRASAASDQTVLSTP
jgi:hypothetical protein